MEITEIGTGIYSLFVQHSKEVVALTAADLLAIAEYVAQHHEELAVQVEQSKGE